MKIKSAEFFISSEKMEQLPKPDKPEFAFVGRSNVGKSSLINALLGKGELARTSAQPGKTQLINHFIVNSKWYLVDLPGYGYAKVSQSQRAAFSGMIRSYITRRPSLMNVFVLVDGRLEPQEADLDFIEMLGENGIPFSVVFTKLDKVSLKDRNQHLAAFSSKLSEQWEELPPFFFTSAETGEGRDEILSYISKCLPLFVPQQV